MTQKCSTMSPGDQQTDTHTTLRATSVTTEHIYALHAGDETENDTEITTLPYYF